LTPIQASGSACPTTENSRDAIVGRAHRLPSVARHFDSYRARRSVFFVFLGPAWELLDRVHEQSLCLLVKAGWHPYAFLANIHAHVVIMPLWMLVLFPRIIDPGFSRLQQVGIGFFF